MTDNLRFEIRRKIDEGFTNFNENLNEYIKIPAKICMWAFISLIIFFVFYAVRFDGLANVDSMDYAQMARRLSEGKGYTTSMIKPQSLLIDPSISDHPELTTPPLYTTVLAGVFKVFKPCDKTVVFTGALFYFLSIPLVYIMALKFFDSKVAYLSLLLYITNSAILMYSISGLQIPLLIFLFMLLILTVYSIDQEHVLRTILAGSILGLCYLTQYSFGLLYFVLIAHIIFLCETRAQKFRHGLYFTLSFLIVISPWLCRNYILTGNPFFSLEFLKPILFTTTFPGNSILRVAREIPLTKWSIGFDVIKKVYFGIKNQYQQLLYLPQNYLMPLFIVSFFVYYENVRTFIIRKFIFWAGVTLMIVLFFFYPGTNLLIPFIPYIIIAAAAFYYSNLAVSYLVDSNWKLIVLTIVFVLVNTYPLVTSVVLSGKKRNMYPAKRMETIAKLTGKDDFIVTDIPWAVAWYSDRNAIWIPYSNVDYVKLTKLIGRIKDIYLSPVLFEYPKAENVKIWKNLYLTRKAPPGIHIAKGTYLNVGGMYLAETAKWEDLLAGEDQEIKTTLPEITDPRM